MESINKELDRLENVGVNSPTEYSEWASPTVYVQKKNYICACEDFFTGLKECLLFQT